MLKKFNISDLIQFVEGDEDIILLITNLTDVCDLVKVFDEALVHNKIKKVIELVSLV